jgi:hypothetical protein
MLDIFRIRRRGIRQEKGGREEEERGGGRLAALREICKGTRGDGERVILLAFGGEGETASRVGEVVASAVTAVLLPLPPKVRRPHRRRRVRMQSFRAP